MVLCICCQRVSRRYIAGWRGSSENPAFFSRCTKEANVDPAEVSFNGEFLRLVDRAKNPQSHLTICLHCGMWGVDCASWQAYNVSVTLLRFYCQMSFGTRSLRSTRMLDDTQCGDGAVKSPLPNLLQRTHEVQGDQMLFRFGNGLLIKTEIFRKPDRLRILPLGAPQGSLMNHMLHFPNVAQGKDVFEPLAPDTGNAVLVSSASSCAAPRCR